MIASDILDRVSMQLNDQGRVRWTLPMLLNYLTDAMRQTVLVRPDANARAHVVKLTPGSTRQRIPEGSLMFLAMVRNMGPDGLTPGRPIEPTTREAMNTLASGWHLEFGSEEIDQYAFVQATPDCFWVAAPRRIRLRRDRMRRRHPPSTRPHRCPAPFRHLGGTFAGIRPVPGLQPERHLRSGQGPRHGAPPAILCRAGL